MEAASPGDSRTASLAARGSGSGGAFSWATMSAADRTIPLLLLSFALCYAFLHFHYIDDPHSAQILDQIQNITAHHAESPYQYRILLPLLTLGLARVAHAAAGLDLQHCILGFNVLLQALGMMLGLVVFYFYLRRWFGEMLAAIGALIVAAVLPIGFLYYFYQPWSQWDLLVFTFGLWLIDEDRFGWLLALLLVATLIRETACFLFVIYALVYLGRKPLGALAAICAAGAILWLTLQMGMRAAFGVAAHVGAARPDALSYRLIYNLTHFDTYFLLALYFGPLWILAFRGLKNKPAVLARAIWFTPLFVAVYMVMSNIHEVRYLLELCPVIVPSALMTLFAWEKPPLAA